MVFPRFLPVAILITCISCAASQPQPPAAVSLPLSFEINRGQTAPQVRYLARAREGTMFFTGQGITVAVPEVGSFRVLFENGTATEIRGEQALLGRSNYLARLDGSSIRNVENFGALRYSSVYPGIDVLFYGQDRHLEHDFLLAPGADPSRISLRLEGIDRIDLQNDGSLKLKLGTTSMFETAPQAWQTVHGHRSPVLASWKLLDENRVGISLGIYDRALPVTIDPVLVYSTHLGGTTGKDITTGSTFSADTFIAFIRLDPARNIYVAGTTSAIDYPTTAGAFNRNPGTQAIFHSDATSQSGFVSKFDPTGRILIYSTFLRVQVDAMAVDSSGHVYTAESAFDESPGPNEGGDLGIFIDKLSADGSKLLFSRQFGQTTNSTVQCQAFSSSFARALAVDNVGHAWLVGSTGNPCLPATPGAFQTKLPNTSETGFAAKFDSTRTPAQSVIYATYLGGSGQDTASGVVIDSAGDAFVTGTSNSPNFPHSRAFGTGASNAAFVLKLNATGSALDFSTLVNGADSATGIALDSSGIYIAGSTSSSGFPTTSGAFKRSLTGTMCRDSSDNPAPCPEGFVTKLNSTASGLVYSTFLGGSGGDSISGLGLNNRGMAFVTGKTTSTDFPTTPSGFKRTLAAETTNAFVTMLQPTGASLFYSTLLGGSKNTTGASIFIDPAWNAWVAGNTMDTDFPVTPDAFQPGRKGESDGFISEVVIAADLSASLHATTSTIARNSVETFIAKVTNHGPDGSDAVVLTDVIPAGFQFAGLSNSTATSCSAPAVGATSGTIVCHKTRLENGQSFGVNILLRAIARSGSVITNRVTTSARTQDLKQSNNAASATVTVH